MALNYYKITIIILSVSELHRYRPLSLHDVLRLDLSLRTLTATGASRHRAGLDGGGVRGLVRGCIRGGGGVRGTQYGENHRQQHQAVEETEDHGQTEHLEESLVDVGGGEAAEQERQEGCCSAVNYSGSDEFDGVGGSLLAAARGHQVGVGDVDSVVYTETDGQHDVHCGEDVDGDAPEVEKSHNVNERTMTMTRTMMQTKTLPRRRRVMM